MKYLFYFILSFLVLFLYSSISKKNASHSDLDKIPHESKYSADWLTDLTVVKAKSSEEGKPIFMNFTGSNWCAACIRLDREIFSNPVFIDYANEHLILMKIDFPLGVEQEESLVTQNNLLYDRYEIGGLPTVVLIDSEGEIFRDYGYGREKAENYINRLRNLLSN